VNKGVLLLVNIITTEQIGELHMKSVRMLGIGRKVSAGLRYVIIMLSVCLPATAFAQNCTELPVSGQLYSIINLGSGAAVDVAAASKQGLANILAWQYNAAANQQFYLRQNEEGYWTITARHSDLNLDVLNFSTAEGGNIVQWQQTGASNQQWQLKRSSTGAVNIVSRHSGKSLTVAGSSNGANIYQHTDMANSSQRWYFNPVQGRCGGQGAETGYASMPGADGLATTSGGGSALPLVVRDCNALAQALASSAPAVVQVPDNTTINCHTASRTQSACAIQCPAHLDNVTKTFYRVPVGTQRCTELGSTSDQLVNRSRNERKIQVKSNKTLIGLGANAQISGASFNLANARNVIIRNLTIKEVNPGLVEAGDGIGLDNSSHIWLDHLRLARISDGYIDIRNSQNVTVSWSALDGYNPAVCGNQHHYTSLAQNAQVTFHHNIWDRVSGRNPKLDGANTRAHLFNNYWRNVTYFAVSIDNNAQARLEASYFDNSAKPHWNHGGGFIDALISSNRYTGRSATDPYKHSGSSWVLSDTPRYVYRVDNVDQLPAILWAGAGPQ
jgi:pectate lyase